MSERADRGVAGEARLEPLSRLAPGRAARLRRHDVGPGEACLLTAMGLSSGCRLVVRQSGDPCIVEVRAARIGIARAVAERLFVQPEIER